MEDPQTGWSEQIGKMCRNSDPRSDLDLVNMVLMPGTDLDQTVQCPDQITAVPDLQTGNL
jgi:hypothetical protein